MEKFLLEHKKLSIFIILLALFYFFIASPIEVMLENKKNYEIKNKRLMGIVTSKKIVEKRLEGFKIKKENLEREYEEKQKLEKSYKTLGEFQEELKNIFIENNIEIIEIGRVILEEDRYIVPYSVCGSEDNIINFLTKTDENKKLSLFKGPFEILKENKRIRLNFSVEVRIERDKNKIDIEKRKNYFIDAENKIEKISSYKLIGDKKGIFYIEDDKGIKRYYFKDGEIGFFNKSSYKVKILEDTLLLENTKNGKRIIFSLEGSGEKDIKN